MAADPGRPGACLHQHGDWLPCDDHLWAQVWRVPGSNGRPRPTLLLGDNCASTPQVVVDDLDCSSHRPAEPGAQERSPRPGDHRPPWARSTLWANAGQSPATLVAW